MKAYTICALVAVVALEPTGMIYAAKLPASQLALPVAMVRFEPLVINKVEVQGATYPIDEPKLRAKMSHQYNEWIVRSATRKKFAQAAESVGGGASIKREEYRLLMVMNIPLTHRADSTHYVNQYKHGKFMDYTLTLSDSDNHVIAKVSSDLVWGDVEWAAPRHRRWIPHDDVMTAFVRKAVDRGIDALKAVLRKA